MSLECGMERMSAFQKELLVHTHDNEAQARVTAQEAGQASAMVAATMGKAKLHGLLTYRQEITSPDESMKPRTIVLVGEPVPDYEELDYDCS